MYHSLYYNNCFNCMYIQTLLTLSYIIFALSLYNISKTMQVSILPFLYYYTPRACGSGEVDHFQGEAESYGFIEEWPIFWQV